MGLIGIKNVDEGHDGQYLSRNTSRSIATNKKQGIGGSKVNGPNKPSTIVTDIGHTR